MCVPRFTGSVLRRVSEHQAQGEAAIITKKWTWAKTLKPKDERTHKVRAVSHRGPRTRTERD